MLLVLSLLKAVVQSRMEALGRLPQALVPRRVR
jgi:hypothetical protein